MRAHLRSYGAAGLLSYGLLNCIYYTVGFLVVYCWVGQAPAGEHLDCCRFVCKIVSRRSNADLSHQRQAHFARLVIIRSLHNVLDFLGLQLK